MAGPSGHFRRAAELKRDLLPTPTESVLLLTAIAAGAVDVVSFASLGGVFASAMTGNFAVLAWYLAQGDSAKALGSIVALLGFVVGCALGVLLRRGRSARQALTLLLAVEAGLLLFFSLTALVSPTDASAPSDHLNILVLAAAMGFQAVIGQTLSETTIVFTTTLTKLVAALADAIAHHNTLGVKDIRLQVSVVVSYLFGALLAGALIVHDIRAVVFVPLCAVSAALAIHASVTQRRK
jgi:uncharacterized membrane protein YoaK (UPF0700 family)